MNRYLLILLIALLSFVMGCASSKSIISATSLQLSTYNFQQLDSLMLLEKRPVAVFLHAPWCQFCRNMEQTTLDHQEIIQLLNNNYYFISFDGEQKEEVRFRDYNFKYQPKGRNSGTHELAKSLGTIDGQLAYPSIVILDPKYEIIFQATIE